MMNGARMRITQQFVLDFLARSACAAVIAFVLVAAGCDSGGQKQESAVAPPEAAPPGVSDAAAGAPPVVPAPAVTQASWAPDALEELLAPIALYPDVLLTQILTASVNAQEVLDGGNWLLQNQNLQGAELDAAAEKAGFGPAMRALVQFPTVVDMMCQQIDWTRQVGSAFTSDQKAVLDSVQRLRAQAAEAGNLKSTPEQKVETKTENEKVIVEVKPADPKVVYVPQYDPQAAYTAPPAAAPAAAPAPATTTTTTTTEEKGVSTGAAVATGIIAFGAGMILANALDDDDDYCYPNWGYGAVYYGPRPFYPPAYVYRPVYSPAFRPAYSYRPPANYRHSYNNVNVRNDVNININNNTNNYFNRFDNNQNLRAGSAQSPLAGTRQAGAGNRAGQPATARRADDWKGQSTYAGARDTATGARAKQEIGGREDAAARARAAERPAVGATRTRPESSAGAQAQARDLQVDRGSRVDRGHADPARTENRPAPEDRAARVENRDPGTVSRPTQTSASARSHDNAFAGAHSAGSGSFDRAASARGRASTGGGGAAREHASRGGGERRR
jgi:hypothetical protein